jgi:CubicO group peptidase (beta-lactamase class C family)
MTGPVTGAADEFAAKLATFVRANRIAGAAASVVHDDSLAWAGGAGFADIAAGRPAEPGILYRIASITKTVTGTAIMRLRDAGVLDLDDRVTEWLPELTAAGTHPALTRVTIRRLLSHESGLMGDPPGTDWAAATPQYDGSAVASLVRAAEIRAVLGPNLQPKYSNLGYQLLGEIVARAGGQEYGAYVRQEILEPLGMADTTFEPEGGWSASRRATGYSGRSFSDELDVAAPMTGIGAEGGLWSTVTDLGRWLCCQLGAHADPPRESPVLSAASLREMHKPRYLSSEAWTQAWGISWYAVRKDEVTWVLHSGGVPGFSSGACFDRQYAVGAAVLVNGVADATGLAIELAAVARRRAQAIAPELSVAAPTPPEYRALLGLYVLPVFGDTRRVEWRDGQLAFLTPSYPGQALPLLPAGEPDTFVVGPGFRDSGELVRFRRRADGRVASAYFASATLLRLDPVDADDPGDADTASGPASPDSAAVDVGA